MPSIRTRLLSALVLLAAGCGSAQAQWQSADAWHFDAILYGYFPAVDGKSKFPERTGGSDIDVSADKIIDALKFAFMGTIEARNGRWGVFSDFVYMDFGASKSRTRDLSIGGTPLPGDVTANASLDLKGKVWTIAGTWRAIEQPGLVADLMAGARMFDYQQRLGWEFSADLGPDQPSRSGNSQIDTTQWDAIVGVKGRAAFGDRNQWFLPYYLDVGAGDSDLTWQAMGGVGYAFGWGDVMAGWRYLKYDLKSGSRFEDVSFSGPMVGLGFHW